METSPKKLPEMAASAKYKRILLKLSGEALMGDDPFGINRATIERIVGEISQVAALGLEIAVVIGGGNIFRGVAPGAAGMDRATADYIGMLATIMNALALQDAMRQAGLNARVQSALNIEQVVEPYIRNKAIRYLEEGRSSFLPRGPATRSLRPIPQRRCEGRRSARKWSSRRPRSTAFIRTIPKSVPTPSVTTS